MGRMDIRIQIERHRRNRNERIKRLKTRINSTIIQENETKKPMDPEIYKAAANDDPDGLKDILERDSLPAIIDQISPVGNTVLHIAAKFGRERNVKILIERYPSLIHEKNSKGDTALHVAAKAGHERIADALVYSQRRVTNESSSSEDAGGRSRIYYTKDEQLISLENEDGNTALHEAFIYRRQAAVARLLNVDRKLWFHLNNEGKSPLYLAVEAGCRVGVEIMLGYPMNNQWREEFTSSNSPSSHGDDYLDEWRKGKSPVHAAIAARNEDILYAILERDSQFIHLVDDEGRPPLHFAAYMGYLEEVRYLLGISPLSAVERDKNGFFPLHIASIKGYINIMHELFPYCHDPEEMLDHKRRNILHLAAKNGKYKVVNYIIKTIKLEKLINERDEEGNTPLHLATMHWHPKIVTALVWCKEVVLTLVNNDGMTALDAAEYDMERMPPFRKRLTWTALKAAGAQRAPKKNGHILRTATRQAIVIEEQPNMDNYKDRVNTLLLVSTLVATVTFAAGFTMPGGYNNSEPDQGTATMLRNSMFQVFVFCDTIAMYSSVIVAVTLIWAQLGDLNLVLNALQLALPLLGVALAMMSLAFMAGIYVVVGKLSWLAIVVLVLGLAFLVVLALLFLPLFLPISWHNRCFRYVSYSTFCLMLLATGCNNEDDVEN